MNELYPIIHLMEWLSLIWLYYTTQYGLLQIGKYEGQFYKLQWFLIYFFWVVEKL